MTHVATLICDPARPALDERHVGAAAQRLPGAQKPLWLAEGVAADIRFTPRGEAEARHLAAGLRETCAGLPVDIIVQPAAGRRKKLLVADMDSTVIGQECLDELAAFVGRKAEVTEVTARAMRGEIAFVPALVDRVALLKGLRIEVVEKILAERIHFTPGAEALVKTMRAHGAFTVLVSSGFTEFAAPIAERLGFHIDVANQLIVRGGELTGRLAEPILDAAGKRAALVRLRSKHGIEPAQTLAVGDGANDLGMLLEAGLGVGFRPKPVVAEKIAARLDHADLTALLYAQGYRREEFVRSEGISLP